jgi:hypothetical protein
VLQRNDGAKFEALFMADQLARTGDRNFPMLGDITAPHNLVLETVTRDFPDTDFVVGDTGRLKPLVAGNSHDRVMSFTGMQAHALADSVFPSSFRFDKHAVMRLSRRSLPFSIGIVTAVFTADALITTDGDVQVWLSHSHVVCVLILFFVFSSTASPCQ